MIITPERIKEIIKEEFEKIVNEASKEKIPAFAVAKKMIGNPYWKKNKGWDKKIIKKFRSKGVSHNDLEQWFPDYIEGKHIAALFEGNLTEGWKKKKYKKNDYKKYNKLVKRGKSVMVQTSFGDEFAWEDGSSHGVFGSESDGREIELSHDDIDIVMHEGGKGSGRKPDDHTGGPSYANVPKGAKTSKQAKAMRKKSKIEKNMDKAVSDANAKLDAAEKAMKKKKVKKEGRRPNLRRRPRTPRRRRKCIRASGVCIRFL